MASAFEKRGRAQGHMLGNALAQAGGRITAAINKAQESVSICQRLAADNPAQYERDLAQAPNLAIRLAEAGGRTAEALGQDHEDACPIQTRSSSGS